MDKTEKKAIEISDKGTNAIMKFVTGFSKFIEEKKELHQKEVLEMYSKMNVATLIYNAMMLEEELNRRTEVKADSSQ